MSRANFKLIAAADIETRIPDLLNRLSPFSSMAPISKPSIDELLQGIANPKDVDALLVSIHQTISEEHLERLSELRYLGVLGTSLKQIPREYCRAHHIKVTNVTEYCDQETAEWVMLKVLEFFRGRSAPRSAVGKAFGVIGVGAVGKHVIDLALAFGMRVFFNANRSHPELNGIGLTSASKEEIFQNCDVISFHTPGFVTWLTAPMLRMARPDSCLINTCMGRVSQGSDLEEVLKERADITLIMDKIAGPNYPGLKGRAHLCDEFAFFTIDSQNRLVDKFLQNLAR